MNNSSDFFVVVFIQFWHWEKTQWTDTGKKLSEQTLGKNPANRHWKKTRWEGEVILFYVL